MPTRSELEDRFVELCDSRGLPRPMINVRVEGYEVDAFWPVARLVVELDGFEFHRTREAFERDRARDAALHAAGHRVLRITHRRLLHEPIAVTRQIEALLAAAMAPGTPPAGS